MKNLLYTYEVDVREEELLDLDLFELLSSVDGEWWALYKPIGEPKSRTIHKTMGTRPETEKILAYDKIRLIAFVCPESWNNKAITEVYDHENQCTYYIDNREKNVTKIGEVRETIHTDKASQRVIFKGTVEYILQIFRENGYEFTSV